MSLEDDIIICEISLKNGEKVRGFFTKGSTASFSYNKDGNFLQKQLKMNKN